MVQRLRTELLLDLLGPRPGLHVRSDIAPMKLESATIGILLKCTTECCILCTVSFQYEYPTYDPHTIIIAHRSSVLPSAPSREGRESRRVS
jgi:hypothetical protein